MPCTSGRDPSPGATAPSTSAPCSAVTSVSAERCTTSFVTTFVLAGLAESRQVAEQRLTPSDSSLREQLGGSVTRVQHAGRQGGLASECLGVDARRGPSCKSLPAVLVVLHRAYGQIPLAVAILLSTCGPLPFTHLLGPEHERLMSGNIWQHEATCSCSL